MRTKFRWIGTGLLALSLLFSMIAACTLEPDIENLAKEALEKAGYTVSFDVNGGNALSTPPQQKIKSGGLVTEPDEFPVYAGRSFGGWFKEAACTNQWNFAADTVVANITLYAKWTVLSGQNSVIFDATGGDPALRQRNVDTGTAIGATNFPSNPIKDNYAFTGWNTKADGTGSAFTAIDSASTNITVYAQWAIAYTVTANGTSNTVKSDLLTFSFALPVTGLVVGDITLTSDTGDATKSSLAGSGTTWNLVISVVTQGDIKVNINKAGIDPAEKQVAVYKELISYTAVPDGTAVTADTSKITVTLAETVPGFTDGNIDAVLTTGTFTIGTITGSGTVWEIPISSVDVAGTVTVTITHPSVNASPKTVDVYKQFTTISSAVQTGGVSGTTDSTGIIITFSAPITGLTAAEVTITNGTGSATKSSTAPTTGDGGSSWTVGLSSVGVQGDVTVAVARTGVINDSTSVAVYKDSSGPISYTAVPDGAADTTTTTKITVTLGETVAGFTAGDITAVLDTGTFTVGTITGSGTVWEIPISSVTAAGTVTVTISHASVDATPQTVDVHMGP